MKSKEKDMMTTYNSDLSKCPVCGGTGWEIVPRIIKGYNNDEPLDFAEPCKGCRADIVNKAEYVKQRSNIPKSIYNSRITEFNWFVYFDSNGKQIDLSKQKMYVHSFIENYERWKKDGIGLYIWSNMRGSGKTFLASCICNELMKRKAIVTKFVSCSNLIEIAKNADKNSLDVYERDPIGLLCNCELLVLDDIGQKITGIEWMSDILYRILDTRMQNKSVTIFTSNIKPSELPLDDRIADRVNKVSQAIPLPEYCVRSREANEIKRSLFKELGLL